MTIEPWKGFLAKINPIKVRTPQGLDHRILEFQADSVELEKQPLPASVQLTYYLLLALVIVAMLWSILAKMDKIISTRGKLISTGKQVVVQPLVNSIIKKFHVEVGQVVKTGQLLVSLDPTFAMADEAQVQLRLASLSIQIKRMEAESAGKPFQVSSDMDHGEATLQSNLYKGRQNEFRAKLGGYDSRLAQAKGEFESFKRRLASLQEQLQAAAEVLKMRQQVFAQGADSRLSVLDAQTRFSSIQAEAEGISNDMKVRQQQIAQVQAEREVFINNWNNEISNSLAAALKERDNLLEQHTKASRLRELAELTSPFDAVVLELGKLSVGSVAKEGEAIMTLVPLNFPLEAEISIETKDIGYVHINDPVRIKLDAFPFQRHGTMEGKLRVVSEDAYAVGTGENKIPTYQARVELTNTALHDVSKDTRLLPGMTITAEIVVGQRRVITYLIYPIMQGLDESLREP